MPAAIAFPPLLDVNEWLRPFEGKGKKHEQVDILVYSTACLKETPEKTSWGWDGGVAVLEILEDRSRPNWSVNQPRREDGAGHIDLGLPGFQFLEARFLWGQSPVAIVMFPCHRTGETLGFLYGLRFHPKEFGSFRDSEVNSSLYCYHFSPEQKASVSGDHSFWQPFPSFQIPRSHCPGVPAPPRVSQNILKYVELWIVLKE